MKKHELRDRVFSILEKYPETRNCDATLVAHYWLIYNQENLIKIDLMDRSMTTSRVDALPLLALAKVQPASTIERMRRIVQNEMGRFWPTDPKVARRRRMNMEEYRKRMIELKMPTL